MEKIPRVGVGIFVVKNDKVLMLQRKNAHGEGTWSIPGGHLEFNETIEECAAREVKEETGLDIKNIRLGPYTNDFFYKEDKHYITLFAISEPINGAPKNMEPHKCSNIGWFSLNDLPNPLFLPLDNLLKTGFRPF